MSETLVIVWAAFAASTAIMSLWRLLWPIFAKSGEDSFACRHKKSCTVIWIVITLILAPLLVPILINDEYRLAYIDGFVEGFKDDV